MQVYLVSLRRLYNKVSTCSTKILYLQLRTKLMKPCQEIKQNWTGQENFDH